MDNSTVDHYATLEIEPTASDAEIKRAYRRLAMESHPDKKPNDPIADEKIRRINGAYEILSDSELRRIYDSNRSVPSAKFDQSYRKSDSSAPASSSKSSTKPKPPTRPVNAWKEYRDFSDRVKTTSGGEQRDNDILKQVNMLYWLSLKEGRRSLNLNELFSFYDDLDNLIGDITNKKTQREAMFRQLDVARTLSEIKPFDMRGDSQTQSTSEKRSEKCYINLAEHINRMPEGKDHDYELKKQVQEFSFMGLWNFQSNDKCLEYYDQLEERIGKLGHYRLDAVEHLAQTLAGRHRNSEHLHGKARALNIDGQRYDRLMERIGTLNITNQRVLEEFLELEGEILHKMPVNVRMENQRYDNFAKRTENTIGEHADNAVIRQIEMLCKVPIHLVGDRCAQLVKRAEKMKGGRTNWNINSELIDFEKRVLAYQCPEKHYVNLAELIKLPEGDDRDQAIKLQIEHIRLMPKGDDRDRAIRLQADHFESMNTSSFQSLDSYVKCYDQLDKSIGKIRKNSEFRNASVYDQAWMLAGGFYRRDEGAARALNINAQRYDRLMERIGTLNITDQSDAEHLLEVEAEILANFPVNVLMENNRYDNFARLTEYTIGETADNAVIRQIEILCKVPIHLVGDRCAQLVNRAEKMKGGRSSYSINSELIDLENRVLAYQSQKKPINLDDRDSIQVSKLQDRRSAHSRDTNTPYREMERYKVENFDVDEYSYGTGVELFDDVKGKSRLDLLTRMYNNPLYGKEWGVVVQRDELRDIQGIPPEFLSADTYVFCDDHKNSNEHVRLMHNDDDSAETISLNTSERGNPAAHILTERIKWEVRQNIFRSIRIDDFQSDYWGISEVKSLLAAAAQKPHPGKEWETQQEILKRVDDHGQYCYPILVALANHPPPGNHRKSQKAIREKCESLSVKDRGIVEKALAANPPPVREEDELQDALDEVPKRPLSPVLSNAIAGEPNPADRNEVRIVTPESSAHELLNGNAKTPKLQPSSSPKMLPDLSAAAAVPFQPSSQEVPHASASVSSPPVANERGTEAPPFAESDTYNVPNEPLPLRPFRNTIPINVPARDAYEALKMAYKGDDTAAKNAIGGLGRIARSVKRGFYKYIKKDDDRAAEVEVRYYNKGIKEVNRREGR